MHERATGQKVTQLLLLLAKSSLTPSAELGEKVREEAIVSSSIHNPAGMSQ